MGVHYAVLNVVEQILFDLLRLELIDEIIDKHIVDYFDASVAADKICENLVSTNAFMRLIIMFLQRIPIEAVAMESVYTKMETHLKRTILHADVRALC